MPRRVGDEGPRRTRGGAPAVGFQVTCAIRKRDGDASPGEMRGLSPQPCADAAKKAGYRAPMSTERGERGEGGRLSCHGGEQAREGEARHKGGGVAQG